MCKLEEYKVSWAKPGAGPLHGLIFHGSSWYMSYNRWVCARLSALCSFVIPADRCEVQTCVISVLQMRNRSSEKQRHLLEITKLTPADPGLVLGLIAESAFLLLGITGASNFPSKSNGLQALKFDQQQTWGIRPPWSLFLLMHCRAAAMVPSLFSRPKAAHGFLMI